MLRTGILNLMLVSMVAFSGPVMGDPLPFDWGIIIGLPFLLLLVVLQVLGWIPTPWPWTVGFSTLQKLAGLEPSVH